MSLRLLQTLAHEPPPVMLALSSDGACGASLDPTGVVRSWKVGAAPVVRSAKPRVTVIAFADPATLLLGDTRGGVRAVDLAEGRVRWEVLRHKGAVRGMALQGDELVTVGEDGSLRAGSPAAAKPRLVVRRSKAFTSLSCSPTGDIVAGSEGKSLTVWTLGETRAIERFSDRSSWAPAEHVFFVDRGRHLLTTRGTSERLWDIGGHRMLRGGGNSYIVHAASDPVRGRFVVARNNEVSVMAISTKPRPKIDGTSRAEVVSSLRAQFAAVLASGPQTVAYQKLDGKACAVALAGDRLLAGVDDGRVLVMTLDPTERATRSGFNGSRAGSRSSRRHRKASS